MARWLLVIHSFLPVAILSKPLLHPQLHPQPDHALLDCEVEHEHTGKMSGWQDSLPSAAPVKLKGPPPDLIPKMTVTMSRPTQPPSSFLANKTLPAEAFPTDVNEPNANLLPPIIASPSLFSAGCTTTTMKRPSGRPCHPAAAETTVHTTTMTMYVAIDCHGCDFVDVVEPVWGCPLETLDGGAMRTMTVPGVETLTSTVCRPRVTAIPIPMNPNATAPLGGDRETITTLVTTTFEETEVVWRTTSTIGPVFSTVQG